MSFQGRRFATRHQRNGLMLKIVLPILFAFVVSIAAFSFEGLQNAFHQMLHEVTGRERQVSQGRSWLLKYLPENDRTDEIVAYVFERSPIPIPNFIWKMSQGDMSGIDPSTWTVEDFMISDELAEAFPELVDSEYLYGTEVNLETSFSPENDDSLACLPMNYELGVVTDVVDGDTIKVLVGNEQYTVRYIGMNTPETVKEDYPVEWFGPEASMANQVMVPPGITVKLYKDTSEVDQYGRILRYVVTQGGLFVNYELVLKGYAYEVEYPPDTMCNDTFRGAQKYAIENESGLWQKFKAE